MNSKSKRFHDIDSDVFQKKFTVKEIQDLLSQFQNAEVRS